MYEPRDGHSPLCVSFLCGTMSDQLLKRGRCYLYNFIRHPVTTSSYYHRRVSSSAASASASTSSTTTRIFHYGTNNNATDNCQNGGKLIRFSELNRRESADLEDALLSKLNNSRDDRLIDPILETLVSRRGNDWIRSVSVPSISPLFDADGAETSHGDHSASITTHDAESITVTIQPPTLLHPKLDCLARNIAQLVQEEMISLIKNHPRLSGLCHTGEEGTITQRVDSSLLHSHIGVTIKMSPRAITTQSASNKEISNQGKALRNVTHFLAVYSCKGGVGKSTIATNLAYQLSSMGGRIGLLDLDVYGPSLPLLVRPDDPTVRQSSPDMGPGMVEPIEHRGVKLMSLGYVSPDSGVPGSGPNGGAAVLRGPMAGRVVAQLLKGTNWGTLDVLVLDLPPGTGDVQLEVCQSLALSGAVAVSTPSSLAWADVRKGVQMFGEMGVSTLALVENMSYFICEGGGRHYPFGRSREWNEHEKDGSSGNLESPLATHFLPSPSHVFHLPISSAVNKSNDSGTPLCIGDSGCAEEELTTFAKLADAISTDLFLLQHGKNPYSSCVERVLSVMIDEAGDSEFDVTHTQLSVDNGHRNFTVRLFSNEGGYQKVISGNDLRLRDPVTGQEDESLGKAALPKSGCGGSGGSQSLSSMVQHHSATETSLPVKDVLFPAKVTKKGNYGYQVEWADGTKSIFSLLALAKAVGAKSLDRRVNKKGS